MYKIPKLEKQNTLFHVFSTINEENMSLIINEKKVNPETVVKNRRKFFKKVGVDINRVMTIWLRHGDKVVEAKKKWLGKTVLTEIEPPMADAVITNEKNVFLALTIADCVPVIIYDPKVKALGLVHAGTEGIDKKIVVKTIRKMMEKYGCDPENMVVGIGPCIGKDSYIKNNFPNSKKKNWGKYAEEMGHGLCSIDLKGFIKEQILEQGINMRNIFESKVNVAEDSRFYSHFVDLQSSKGDRGRFLVVSGIM